MRGDRGEERGKAVEHSEPIIEGYETEDDEDIGDEKKNSFSVALLARCHIGYF